MKGRERWSPGVRRLGIVSSAAIVGVGILYVGVIALWLIVEATPREPIGDPYLAVMEVLTIVSGLAILGFVIAMWCFADEAHRLFALSTLIFGSLGVGLTMAVHFVQLTAVRQMWQGGQIPDYRLVWPSILFAVEYFAWDILVGLTMVTAGLSLSGSSTTIPARRALLIGGVLCLAGAAGPLSGWMLLQNVSLLGYAVVLPVAGVLSARMFHFMRPTTDSVVNERTP